MSRSAILKSAALVFALVGFAGASEAKAQDWGDYLHWPYVPPQVPGNGFQQNGLYDGFYLYPREQRIVPQIQGPYYENFYGGKLFLGHFRKPFMSHHGLNKTKFYSGYHNTLDVF